MRFKKNLVWAGSLICLLASREAVSKSVTLALALFPTQGCNFSGGADTDLNWKHLKEVKLNGVKKLRHGKVVVENYPQEITLHLMYWLYGLFESYSLGDKKRHDRTPTWDPAKVHFSAAWRNRSGTVTAKGVQLNAQHLVSEIWCEQMRCPAYWTYEIRLDSENIPIGDELVVTVHAEDGKVVSVLTGRLEQVNESAIPTSPSP